MKPELTPLSGARKARQSAHLRIHQQRHAPLGDRADLRAGEREDVGREGHRLGVEVAPGEHLAGVGKHQRVVGDGIGLGHERRGLLRHQVQARAHDLRLTAQRVGILHARAGAVRFADLAAREQRAIHLRDARLAVVAAHVVNARIKGRIAPLQRIGGEHARDHGAGIHASRARTVPRARAPWTPGCRSAAPVPPSARAPGASAPPARAPRRRAGSPRAGGSGPVASTASDRCASGARSPEAPTEPCAGTHGYSPRLISASRKRASAVLTPEKPCNRLASLSTSVRRTIASSSSGPTPALWERMMLRCRSVRCAGAMRVCASRPKPVLMP